MLIKINGLHTAGNIEAIQTAGVDIIGLDLPENDAARTTLSQWIQDWSATTLLDLHTSLAVANAEVEEVLNAVHDYSLDFVELQGEERPEYCGELVRIWNMGSMHRAQLIKTFQLGPDTDFSQITPYGAYCKYFIFDASPPDGKTAFNVELLQGYEGPIPFLLRGRIGLEHAAQVAALDHNLLMGVDLGHSFIGEDGQVLAERVKEFIAMLKR